MKKTHHQLQQAENTPTQASHLSNQSNDYSGSKVVHLNPGEEISNTLEVNSDTNLCIREAVTQSMQQYFDHLGDQDAQNLYQMVLNEVEPALLKAVLEHTRGNQSKASVVLGLNRGTLRKKLQTHNID